MNPAARGLLPDTSARDYRTGVRIGSAEHYKARMEHYARVNDDLRAKLDLANERDTRRCAFLRGLNG